MYFDGSSDYANVDKSGWTAPALEAGDVWLAMPSLVSSSWHRSSPRHDLARRSALAIPVAAQGVHRADHGHEDPRPREALADSPSRK